MIIRGFVEKDAGEVADLVASAFGQADEADLCVALRQGGHMSLELVAEDKGRIVGHVALSRMVAPERWLALAPVSVEPKRQRKGIGGALVQMALDYANAPVVVLGDPAYYSKFGFEFDRCEKMKSPYPLEYTGLYAPEIEEKTPPVTLEYSAPFMG